MSGRTKVRGNRAITCDAPGCQNAHVAHWWGSTVDSARAQAKERGWTRCHSPQRQRRDICPSGAHARHLPDCACIHSSPSQREEIRGHR